MQDAISENRPNLGANKPEGLDISFGVYARFAMGFCSFATGLRIEGRSANE